MSPFGRRGLSQLQVRQDTVRSIVVQFNRDSYTYTKVSVLETKCHRTKKDDETSPNHYTVGKMLYKNIFEKFVTQQSPNHYTVTHISSKKFSRNLF